MTNAVTLASMGNGPAFSYYWNGASQTLTNSTTTKVTFNTAIFDTNNCYSSATNRFTPTVAGYYQLGFVGQSDYVPTGRAMAWIYKNGSALMFQEQNLNSPASTYPSFNINAVVYANGTTDYFEIYVRQESGSSSKVVYGNSPGQPNVTYFNGAMVRGA